MAGLCLAVLLSSTACSRPEPTSDNPSIQWFEPDVREEAYDVDLDFDLSFEQDSLRVKVDIHNDGDFLIGYRSYESSDLTGCVRMMVAEDRVDVLLEPYKEAVFGGYVGTMTPVVTLVEPGDSKWWGGLFSTTTACSDITRELKSEHPTQLRVCFGLVKVPPDYVADDSGEKAWRLPTDDPPVLVCSPSVDLPPEWYGG